MPLVGSFQFVAAGVLPSSFIFVLPFSSLFHDIHQQRQQELLQGVGALCFGYFIFEDPRVVGIHLVVALVVTNEAVDPPYDYTGQLASGSVMYRI